jgi:hypothetical protein
MNKIDATPMKREEPDQNARFFDVNFRFHRQSFTRLLFSYFDPV